MGLADGMRGSGERRTAWESTKDSAIDGLILGAGIIGHAIGGAIEIGEALAAEARKIPGAERISKLGRAIVGLPERGMDMLDTIVRDPRPPIVPRGEE